jgi:hypothetical protein
MDSTFRVEKTFRQRTGHTQSALGQTVYVPLFARRRFPACDR